MHALALSVLLAAAAATTPATTPESVTKATPASTATPAAASTPAALPSPVAVAPAAAPGVPDSPKKPVVDTYQGVSVSDDYRWLENQDDPEVKTWSDAQNAHSRAFLDALPHRDEIKARLSFLIRSTSERYGALEIHGGLLFGEKFEPRKQQPFLVTLKGPDDKASEKVLVDPNTIDSTGHTAMDFWVPSLDGKLVAVSLSRNGTEQGDLHLFDVVSGKELPDVIPHVNNGTAGGSATFNADSTGFWYTHYPDKGHAEAGAYQELWFHKIGSPIETDVFELGRELPKIAEIKLYTKPDGKWVLAEVLNGDGGEVEYFLRQTAAAPGETAAWTQVSTFNDKAVEAVFGLDDALYIMSRASAPRGRILRLPLATPTIDKAVELVKEDAGAIQFFLPTKTKLYVVDVLGGPSQVRAYELATGAQLKNLPILDVSSVTGLTRLDGDNVLLENMSYLKPPAWYRYVPKLGTVKTALFSKSVADYSDATVVRDFAISKDGTKIPVNVIMKKGTKLDGNNPAVMTAYGGFGVSQIPTFSSVRRMWLDQGGIWVEANIRGGGEFGDQWHLDGALLKKQNDYDDFYACAEWLITNKYTSRQRLGILGGSNGGLLMGAAVTQHPEEYAAVVSQVGVYDMLRVETTPNGAFIATEYGSVKNPDQFKALYGYSPYHHVVDGTKYPPILITTGANDPRVDPWHSRKFAARMQAASPASTVLLWTSNDSGHIGSSMDQIIEERTDSYGFFFKQLGVDYRDKGKPTNHNSKSAQRPGKQKKTNKTAHQAAATKNSVASLR